MISKRRGQRYCASLAMSALHLSGRQPSQPPPYLIGRPQAFGQFLNTLKQSRHHVFQEMALVEGMPGLLDETCQVSSDVRHETSHPFLVDMEIFWVYFSACRWFLAYEQKQGGEQADDSVGGNRLAAEQLSVAQIKGDREISSACHVSHSNYIGRVMIV